MNFIPLSWSQLEKDTITLAKKIQGEYGIPDEIVAIAKGGVVVGRIFADIFNVPLSFITLESYHNLQQDQQPIITQPSVRRFNREKILLIDDLADTGSSFVKALDYLKSLPISSIITASPYIKPQTKYIPDFWVKKLDGWVIFPYELRETKAAFIEKFGLEQAKKQLKKLGILDWTTIK